MNKILAIGASLLILISIIIFPTAFSKYKLLETGELVTITIIKLPNCNGGRNQFIKIKYDNLYYTLRTKCKYVKNLKAGQATQMLHKSGTSIFSFSNEDFLSNLIAVICIGLLGIVILIIAIKNIRKNKIDH